jgi:hypothetical protein
MSTFKPFTLADIGDSLRVTVNALDEDYSYKTSYADDPEFVASIDAMVAKDELWGWCVVCVSVTHVATGLAGDAFLGGCSYENQNDFIENSDYYNMLVADALAELNDNINNLLKKLPYHDQA